MEDLKRNDLATSDDGMAECTIPDSELADVSGGIYVGQYAYVSGPVYLTRYAEEGEQRGSVDGYFHVVKYYRGYKAPACISPDGISYRGWVKEESVHKG